MYDCLITFRSVMPAQRAEGILQARKIGCAVRRTPKWMESQGCGYCLRLSCGRLPEAVALLEDSGIRYKKLYRHTGGDRMEEMRL